MLLTQEASSVAIMKIEYRKVNSHDTVEMNFIAEQDSKIPLEYDSDYKWNEKSVGDRLDYFKRMKPDDFFEVAVVENKIVGFHLVYKFPYPPDLQAGMIATLWVDQGLRGKGIGSELKRRGEIWARENKLSFLQTGVHVNNSKMMEINEKNGFEIISYDLRKKLL